MNLVQGLKAFVACGIISAGAVTAVHAASINVHSDDSQSPNDCSIFHKTDSHDKDKVGPSKDRDDFSCDWILDRCDDENGHTFKLKHRNDKSNSDQSDDDKKNGKSKDGKSKDDKANDDHADCYITCDEKDVQQFIDDLCKLQGSKHGKDLKEFDFSKYKQSAFDVCWQFDYSDIFHDSSKGKTKGDESCEDWFSNWKRCHDDHHKCDGPPVTTGGNGTTAVPVPAAAWSGLSVLAFLGVMAGVRARKNAAVINC